LSQPPPLLRGGGVEAITLDHDLRLVEGRSAVPVLSERRRTGANG